jgi:hypothetical protein
MISYSGLLLWSWMLLVFIGVMTGKANIQQDARLAGLRNLWFQRTGFQKIGRIVSIRNGRERSP